MGTSDKAVAVFAASATTTTTTSRLKREDCPRTKHDSIFLDWKILIGSSDWQDHLLNKEGSEKYRTQNLPNCSSCSGAYELGIAVSCSPPGQKAGKLDKKSIIPIYIGEADNVRTRMQQYGRDGAHLETRGLFSEIFLRGYPIVYRWAPMKSKRDAEKTEAQLLETFDYAWNKGSNGARRRSDILQKLDRISSTTTGFPIARKLQIFPTRKVGRKIESCEPFLSDNGSRFYTYEGNNDILSRIFKFGRSQPRSVVIKVGAAMDLGSVCGVALGQGSICIRHPDEGRKRCAEHKGMKVNASTSKLIAEGNTHVDDEVIRSRVFGEPEHVGHKSASPTCGFALNNDSPCTSEPAKGRKRCEEHRGRKVCGSVSKSITEEKEYYVPGPVSSGTCKPGMLYSPVSSQRPDVNRDFGIICGFDLGDGRFCTRQPVVGRVRCEEHKGMRVKKQTSRSKVVDIPSIFVDSGFSHCNEPKYEHTPSFSIPCTSRLNDDTSACGAATLGGSFCSRKPSKGSKWCWQHEGKRIDESTNAIRINDRKSNNTITQAPLWRSTLNSDPSPTCGAITRDGSFCSRKQGNGSRWCWQHEGTSVSSCYESKYSAAFSRPVSYRSFDNEGFSSTCGAITQKGSFCSRRPAAGRNRCWQH